MKQNINDSVFVENGYEYFYLDSGALIARLENSDFRVDYNIDEQNNTVAAKKTIFKNNEKVLVVNRRYADGDEDTNYCISGMYVSKAAFWFEKNAENIKNKNIGQLIVNLFGRNDSVGKKLPDPVVGRPTHIPS